MAIVVHGHFYQPPRENPWTGRIDYQPGAAPFHDWNERIHAECYRPNAFAEILTDEGERLLNNFERLSFNIGPTLFSWLAAMHPRTYRRMVEADATSAERLGHGNALAQSFHHTILPLSPVSQVRTEVRWGLADFRHRFGRDADGMWLPETAVNDDVLGVLVDESVAFTVLAPHQAGRLRSPGGDWQDLNAGAIDTRQAYRWMHPDNSGRSLALFFYDGVIARQIAFENAMSSAEGFIELFAAREEGGLAHAAADGETYGHHQKFGDIGLAYALFAEAPKRGLDVTNYATWLAATPPEMEVELSPGEGTSWSCSHGVGRWKEDCGCSARGLEGWNQKWRTPLREALDLVRDAADETFERLGASLFSDPWRARDRYAEVVVGATALEDLLSDEAAVPVGDDEVRRGGALLELQRSSLSMFTSCAWFFSDISDIETVQIMRYAARTLEMLDEMAQTSPRAAFLEIMEQAESNVPERGTGADIFTSLF